MSSQKQLEGMIFDVQSFSVHDGGVVEQLYF